MDSASFFREITLRICSTLDIQTALLRCYDYLATIWPVTEAALGCYDAKNHVATYTAHAVDGRPCDSTVYPIPEPFRDVVNTYWPAMDECIIINRPDGSSVSNVAYTMQPGRGSRLYLRLELEGRRVGVFCLLTDDYDSFTPEDMELMRQLVEPFTIAMSNALRYRELNVLKDRLDEDNRFLRDELAGSLTHDIVGADCGLSQVMELVHQVAPSPSPVLLLGETGTGKEIIAGALHAASPRHDGPFIKVNCGAIPESLMDSELFGHEKGAFTGALSRKRGRFERADGGTIFLDEIGELPPAAQVRLLRVLQQHEIERVGGTEPLNLDIRVIAATHRDLEEMVRQGRFREDLWFRLNVFPIPIPPLRERPEDIPALVHYFLRHKAHEMNLPVPELAPGTMQTLASYPWQGNVRELENMVERALIRHRGGALTITTRSHTTIPVALPVPAAPPAFATLDELTARHIRTALDRCRGRVKGADGAAALLGINPSTLRSRMDRLGIPYGRRER